MILLAPVGAAWLRILWEVGVSTLGTSPQGRLIDAPQLVLIWAAIGIAVAGAVRLPLAGIARVFAAIAAAVFASYTTDVCMRFALSRLLPYLGVPDGYEL